MNSFEFELWIEQYKAIIKERGAERPLFPDEITKLDENIEYIPEEYKDAYDCAKQGDFSKFETLPHLLRNYLGALELKKFRDEFGETPSLEDERVRQYLEDNAMNAALRAGISAEKNAEKTRDYAMALDSHMSHILMKRTMLPTTEQWTKNLDLAYGNSSVAYSRINMNMEKQLILAKAMLLAQVGKYDIIEKNELGRNLGVPVYETLVHGNRTNFILPAGRESQEVLNAFMGPNGGVAAGIKERTAATHWVKRRTIGKNGLIKSDGKEQRTYSPFKVFSHQYGMDIAVGGFGQEKAGGGYILGQGEEGHMYMRAEAGDEKHCASLLIGIEGSAPQMDSALGNKHGIMAKSAKQSAFLADKAIVGKKVGGRQVDLSGISAEALASLLETFSEKYEVLQKRAFSPKGREQLSRVNEMLMGKHMDREAFAEMLTLLEINDKTILETFDTARKGYFNPQNVNVGGITEEDFKQSFRARFSQEQACSIAEARFAYAEKRLESDSEEAEADSLELASGAIKELMLTHETRSMWWKIRHPIKNYRENKTISDLMTRLEEKFEKEAIASAFGFYDNTFALNWGEGLSNDRQAVKFAKEAAGAKMFKKPPEEKLPDVFQKVREDIRKKISPKEAAEREQTAMREEFAQYEPELFKDSELGLPQEPKGEYTENYVRMMRQKIVINEVNAADESMELSDEVVPEQPTKEANKEL